MANLDARTISALQTGKPVSTYRKVKKHLGKVGVEVWNTLENRPEGLLLEGEYGELTGVISTWTEQEDIYFQRRNRNAMLMGLIEKVKEDETVEPEPQPLDMPDKAVDDMTDDDIITILNQRSAQFSKSLGSVTSDKLLKRMIELAKREEKSDRIVASIVAKLSEVQGLST